MSLFFNLYTKNTDNKRISQCVDVLNKGGAVIYPTDSVYAIGVSLLSIKGVDKLHDVKKVKKGKHNFSLICNNISMASNYISQLSKTQYKILNKNLPGPFTFVLETNIKLPRKLSIKRKNMGIRVPKNPIPRLISEQLGCPILTTSLKKEGVEGFNDYYTDPETIYENWKNVADVIINGGAGNNYGSTVVELLDDSPLIIRQGIEELLI